MLNFPFLKCKYAAAAGKVKKHEKWRTKLGWELDFEKNTPKNTQKSAIPVHKTACFFFIFFFPYQIVEKKINLTTQKVFLAIHYLTVYKKLNIY